MPLKVVRRKGQKNYYIRGSHKGKELFISAGTSDKREAERLRLEIENEVTRIEAGKITFREAVNEYISRGGEEEPFKKILPVLGSEFIDEIDQIMIDRACALAYPTQMSSTKVRWFYTPIASVLHLMHDIGHIPYLRIKKPKVKNKPAKFATVEWMQSFHSHANKPLSDIVIFLTYTGTRCSEALRLTWDNISLENKSAYVEKTKNSHPRTVYLPDNVVEMLATRRGTGRVFHEYKHYTAVNRAIKRLCDAHGLPYLSSHQVGSHTYATWMRHYGGVDDKGLLATGRWKDFRSVHRYAHANKTLESQKADLLPRAFSVHTVPDKGDRNG